MNNSQTYPASISWPAGIFFLCVLLISVVFYATFEKISANEISDTNQTLASVGQLKANQIQSYLAERKGDAAVISSFLANSSAQHWLTHQGGNPPAILIQVAESILNAYQYKGLLLLDDEANIRLNTGNSEVLTEVGKAVALRALREQSPASFKIYFGDPSTPDEPILDTFVPVMSPDGTMAIGMIVLRSELKFLFRLLQTWPVESETAETLLVTKDGNDVLFLNELRHQKGTAVRLRIPLNTDPNAFARPAMLAVAGQSGLLEAYDYRGKPILAYTLAVPDTPWSMVVKMDIEEAVEHSQRLVRVAIIIAVIFTVFTAIIVWLWWRKGSADRLANGKLQESEARYRRLHESMMDAFVMVDMSGRLLDVNHTFREILGYSTEELLRLTCSDLTPEKWHDLEARIIEEQVIPQGYSQVYERECLRKDGTVFPVELKAFLLRDENNQPEAMWFIVRDITERKRLEMVLRRNEESLNRAQTVGQIGSWLLDIPTNRLEWSAETYRMFGIPQHEAIDLGTFVAAIHPDDRDFVLNAWGEAMAGALYDIEHRIVVGGQARWVRERAQIERDAEGRPLTGIGTVQDITDHKLAEDALRESESRYRLLVESSPLCIHEIDLEGRMQSMNKAGLDMLHLDDARKICGVPYLSAVSQQDSGRIGGLLSDAIDNGTPSYFEFAAAGDESLYFKSCFIPIKDAHGKVLKLMGITEDITKRKETEQRMRELTSHLLTVREEEKASIAREIHDDLGGTLTALKMEAFWLAEELSAGKESESLLNHVELISHLTENAVNVTRRVITGLRPTVLDDLGLLAALEWQGDQFRKHTGITCRVNSIEDKIKLDRQYSIALFRIFQEALTNVARHSGATRVEVEYHSSDEEVVLSVSDNGHGLPDGHIVAPTSYGVRGMRERVEQLGGKIKFDSPPGGGFNVTVTLPLPAEIKMESKK